MGIAHEFLGGDHGRELGTLRHFLEGGVAGVPETDECEGHGGRGRVHRCGRSQPTLIE